MPEVRRSLVSSAALYWHKKSTCSESSCARQTTSGGLSHKSMPMITELIFDNESVSEDSDKSRESALSESTETGSASGRPRVSGSLTKEPPVGGATREFATSVLPACCTPSADTRVICRGTETTARLSPVLDEADVGSGAQRSDALAAEAMARTPWAVPPRGGTTVVVGTDLWVSMVLRASGPDIEAISCATSTSTFSVRLGGARAC